MDATLSDFFEKVRLFAFLQARGVGGFKDFLVMLGAAKG